MGISQKINIGKELVELKENCSLFALMAIAAKSRTYIDLVEDIGTYELSCVSSALFAQTDLSWKVRIKKKDLSIGELVRTR